MKKIKKEKLVGIILLFCLFNLSAQVKHKAKLGIETGVLVSSNFQNLGLFLNVEPKFKLSENSVIGLRFAISVNSRTNAGYDRTQFSTEFQIGNDVLSFSPTFDYFLKKNESNFCPYVGFGLGYYVLANYGINASRNDLNTTENELGEKVNDQLGFLLRSGFESGKFRFGLEYNFIPKAGIEIPNGQIIGKVNDSYFGMSFGFTIGGGKKSN